MSRSQPLFIQLEDALMKLTLQKEVAVAIRVKNLRQWLASSRRTATWVSGIDFALLMGSSQNVGVINDIISAKK